MTDPSTIPADIPLSTWSEWLGIGFFAALCLVAVGVIGWFVWGLRQTTSDADDYDDQTGVGA